MIKGKLLGSILVVCLYAGCKGVSTNGLLPKSFRLKKVQKSFSYPFFIYLYEVTILNKKFIASDLTEYPKRCNCSDCILLKWIKFHSLRPVKNRTHILEIVEQQSTLEKIGNEKTVLHKLLPVLNKNEEVLFAGCYELSKNPSGSYDRFYEYMYFLDVDNGILYILIYMGENY